MLEDNFLKKIIYLILFIFTYNIFALTSDDVNEKDYNSKLQGGLDNYPKFNQDFAKENPYQGVSNQYPEFDKKNSVENPYAKNDNSGNKSDFIYEKPGYPEFDRKNSTENPYDNSKYSSNKKKYYSETVNERNEKYNRILIIYMTGSDGNPNGLSEDIKYEKEYYKNIKGFNVTDFLEIETRQRQVTGTNLHTGEYVSVVQDAEYVFPKDAGLDSLPQTGVIFTAVPINKIRDGIYDNGISYLLEWVSNERYVGKIRIVGHGSSHGTVGMDVYGYHEPRISLKHLVVARWLVKGGIIKNKYDKFHTNPGVLAQYGLRTIHVASCLAGSYDPHININKAGTGKLDRNKIYHHKLNNIDTFNLQPDYGDKQPLPPWAYHVEGVDYGSGIAQYEGVLAEEYDIHGVRVTGAMDSIVVGFDGKYHRTVDDGTPEQVFIYRTFYEAYSDYKTKAAPYENSGYSAGSQYLNLKERRYRFEQRIINGRKELVILSKSIREGNSSTFKQENVTEAFEINFVKTKIPPGMTSGTIIIPPTKYCLMVVGDGSGYSHVTLTEVLAKSPNKLRVIT